MTKSTRKRTNRPPPVDDPPGAQLPYLETFAKVAELSSFTGAARELGFTQATVSHRIQALERQLRVSLFRREKGRVMLSPQGQQLYGFTSRILGLHAEAIEKLTGQRLPLPGELTLGTNSIPAEYLIPGVLAAVRKQYPALRVRVVTFPSEALIDHLEHGELDLALIGMRSDNPDLEFIPFTEDELLVVVSADHPWARKRSVSLNQFLQQPLVLRERGSGSRWCLEQALARHGNSVADLDVVVEFGSNEGIKQMLQQEAGVSVLSRQVVADELTAGRLHAVKVRELELRRKLYVARDRRRVLSAPQQFFLDTLRRTYK